MWVCNCHAVTDHEIRDLLESPFINTVEDVGRACGAGTGCGGCRGDIARLCAEAVTGALVEAVAIAETAVRVEVRSRPLRSLAG